MHSSVSAGPASSIILEETSVEAMMLYCGDVEVCIMNASLKSAGSTGTRPERMWIIEAWRERREQLVRRVRRRDRRVVLRAATAVHAVAALVDRIEARVRVPGLVVVDTIDALREHPRGVLDVVAEPVVGGIREHRDHGLARSRPSRAGSRAIFWRISSGSSSLAGTGPITPRALRRGRK